MSAKEEMLPFSEEKSDGGSAATFSSTDFPGLMIGRHLATLKLKSYLPPNSQKITFSKL